VLYFPNILDVMVLENIDLSEDNINVSSDKIGRSLLWSVDTDIDFCHQSVIYATSIVYFNRTLISRVHGLNIV
jgi:hypothetical protein